MRRLLAAVAVAVLGAGPALVATAPVAHADPIAGCTPTTGTIIAVDYGHWGGPIVRGCGVHSATGYDLLHDGGFTTAGDNHDGPAFVCRIGNAAFAGGAQYPTPKTEACVLTPPATAYWSYWLAPAGQDTWSYSQLGAMSEVPKQGEVELWEFGGTDIAGTTGSGVPTVSPASLRAQATPNGGSGGSDGSSSAPVSKAPAHAPAASSPAAPRGGSSSARTPAAPTTSTTSTTSRTSRTPPAPTCPSGPASASPCAATTGASSSPSGYQVATVGGGTTTVVSAQRTADTRTDHGSILPAVLGGGLAALLALGAGTTVWRRRRDA